MQIDSASEKRSILSLASIFSFRMLGLFMILPVFALYAHGLIGATPALIGVALGIYGLTQALLQIPFGMLSDRIGRKPIITIGLCCFILGSIIAALSHSIYGIIIGRALQGMGAIGSTLIALIADLTREEHRTKAMAVVGMVIGASFSIAMVAGPVLNHLIGVNGIFWFTALLGFFGIGILHTLVPTPKKCLLHSDSEAIPSLFKRVLSHTELLRLNLGIFMQHAILTATFVVIPVTLIHTAHFAEAKQWEIYLPVLILSFLAMVPFIIIAEKKRRMKPVFLAAIATLALAQFGLAYFHQHANTIAFWLFVFFTGFNLLEASLPSLVSKLAPAGSKGTAMGVYSTCQFLGIFFGGVLGGWLYGQHYSTGVFYANALLAVFWFIIAWTMAKPKHLSSKILPLGKINLDQTGLLMAQLRDIVGIEDVAISTEEGIAYLKIDNDTLNQDDWLRINKRYGNGNTQTQ